MPKETTPGKPTTRRCSGPRLSSGRSSTASLREVAFIHAKRDDVVAGRRLGAELICRMLQVAPSSC
jgi:hypothetical protein